MSTKPKRGMGKTSLVSRSSKNDLLGATCQNNEPAPNAIDMIRIITGNTTYRRSSGTHNLVLLFSLSRKVSQDTEKIFTYRSTTKGNVRQKATTTNNSNNKNKL